MKKRLLIVDDEPSIRKVLQAHLQRAGHEVDTAVDGGQAIAKLGEQLYHAVVTDLKMPGIGGLELLHWVRQNYPGLPVVVITAHGTVDTAVEALKLGAHDYVTKPFDRDELLLILEKALKVEEANAASLAPETGRFDIIGTVPSMHKVFHLIERVADSPTTVLITGESGTGKELVAKALHDQSSRATQPFITVNCGAIPETLFESELFGHERGAFTGAVGTRPGRFELADGGTLFLDEVGELPLDLQVKLLRVLQERRFERVGGVRPLDVDVRLVAATNRDLRTMVEAGEFRQDLFYRLAVVPLALPPLRDRLEDLPILVDHFVERFNDRLGRTVRGADESALAKLRNWHWPGNIRELENLIERCVLLAESDVLTADDVMGLDEGPAGRDPADVAAEDAETRGLGLKEWIRVHTARLERARIVRALEAEDHNVTRAARRLDISRKSLQTKMKEYRLRDE